MTYKYLPGEKPEDGDRVITPGGERGVVKGASTTGEPYPATGDVDDPLGEINWNLIESLTCTDCRDLTLPEVIKVLVEAFDTTAGDKALLEEDRGVLCPVGEQNCCMIGACEECERRLNRGDAVTLRAKLTRVIDRLECYHDGDECDHDDASGGCSTCVTIDDAREAVEALCGKDKN